MKSKNPLLFFSFSSLLLFSFSPFLLFCFSASAFAQSPYIHKVFEFHPAPGQHIHEIPKYKEGDT